MNTWGAAWAEPVSAASDSQYIYVRKCIRVQMGLETPKWAAAVSLRVLDLAHYNTVLNNSLQRPSWSGLQTAVMIVLR
jgi:hypothetical protein